MWVDLVIPPTWLQVNSSRGHGERSERGGGKGEGREREQMTMCKCVVCSAVVDVFPAIDRVQNVGGLRQN